MTTREEIDFLRKGIENIQNKINAIQEKCQHEEKIVSYSWRIGSQADAHVCKHCDKFIQYVSQRENLSEMGGNHFLKGLD